MSLGDTHSSAPLVALECKDTVEVNSLSRKLRDTSRVTRQDFDNNLLLFTTTCTLRKL